MTNFEKYKDQILKMAKEQQQLSVAFANNQIFSCQDIFCGLCNFNSTINCTSNFIEWLYKEYKEPLKLTQKQRYFFLSIEGQIWRIKREIDDYGNNVYRLQAQSGQIKIIPTFIFSCDILELNKWYEIEELLQWPIKDD